MENLIGKPRVFLSHSKKDMTFISKIDADLRRCQIDPWLDAIEIRAGKPWLDSIFKHGIPSCDAVLVYLTPSSLESRMVQKEIDASIIHQLDESGVAFLPYVNTSELRSDLRPDLRALQMPEWHDQNYYEMLPTVVAEVWRSYSERVLTSGIQREKVGRLEAELALEKVRKANGDGIFSSSEQLDFAYIWKSLNRNATATLESTVEAPKPPETSHPQTRQQEATIQVSINVGSMLTSIVDQGGVEYSAPVLANIIMRQCTGRLDQSIGPRKDRRWNWKEFPKIENELLMYGLLQKVIMQEDGPFNRIRMNAKAVISEKMYRFRYWLAVQDILASGPIVVFDPSDVKKV